MDFRKRKSSSVSLMPYKKQRNELESYGIRGRVKIGKVPGRTSNLQAPIMLLTGHEGDILTSRFSPSGVYLASSGYDRLIYLWSVFGECENFHTMKGHGGAVMEIDFSTDGSQMITCATDKTLASWDMDIGERQRKFRGHSSFVNSVNIARRGPSVLCSGSDDGTIKLWDSRKKIALETLQNTYQVTSVRFNDTSEQIFSGGIDNDIKVWDLKKNSLLYSMRGHTDTVTGLALSPDGSYLLSTAMDNSVRIWDVRPFAPQERCVKIFQGNQHTFEKNLLRVAWSPDGSKVAAGSGDCHVYIWDTTTRRILYKLPGHQGSVNQVDFHPSEPIVLSCSSDKKIYIGEIE